MENLIHSINRTHNILLQKVTERVWRDKEYVLELKPTDLLYKVLAIKCIISSHKIGAEIPENDFSKKILAILKTGKPVNAEVLKATDNYILAKIPEGV